MCYDARGSVRYFGLADGITYIPMFLTALMNELQARHVTTIYSLETHDLSGLPTTIPISSVSALTETMLMLRYVEAAARVHRLISITKLPSSDYNPSIRELSITGHGIDVAATSKGAEAALVGLAHSFTGRSGGSPAGKRGGRH